ncbi:MAG TPA: hypothetical protein VLF63_01365 [Patescibacteria group bacterium]|nr:hypothetical protein [Patescibacteria group bacterium]
MKKFYQFLATIFLGLALSVVTVAADSNTSSCDIFETGSNSFNSCETNVENNVTISCKNNIYVVNNNDQSSASGEAVVTDNSSSGNANSGSASNNNGTFENIGASCAPINKETTTTTTAPQQVAAAPTQTPTTTPVVKSLPETGSNSAINDAKVAGLGVSALAVISGLSLAVYRRLALR